MYEGHLKSNVTHFGVSEIDNTVQPYRCEYVSEGYSRLYTKFYAILLSFVSLTLVLVCQKVVIEPPCVKYRLLTCF